MIKLVRLDYRLLHGQVVLSWCGHLSINRIIIVDDDAASDEMKKSALQISKPSGIKLNIFTIDRFLGKLDKIRNLNENIFIIFGNIQSLTKVYSYSRLTDKINYGGLSNKDGTRQYGSAIFMTEQDVLDTKKIMDSGVEIFIQQTPSSKIETLKI